MACANAERAALALLLGLWTAGGFAVAATLAWTLNGVEIIAASSLSSQRRVEALGIGATRTYVVGDIRNSRTIKLSSRG